VARPIVRGRPRRRGSQRVRSTWVLRRIVCERRSLRLRVRGEFNGAVGLQGVIFRELAPRFRV
jgi:hypothetical protein